MVTPSCRTHRIFGKGSQDTPRTWFIVDVDGVLNVNARISERLLVLTNAVVKHTKEVVLAGTLQSNEEILMTSLACQRIGPGESDIFASLASDSEWHLCQLLVTRLARLLRQADGKSTVVLSSSWRRKQLQGHVRHLERLLSQQLGERFSFGMRTPVCADNTPAARLRCIGDFLKKNLLPEQAQRVLVLEDFFSTPLNGWKVGGVCMDSARSVEGYLLSCCGPSDYVEVKLVHTFQQLRLPPNILMDVSVGLTKQKFAEATIFVKGGSHGCSFPEGMPAESPTTLDTENPTKGGGRGCSFPEGMPAESPTTLDTENPTTGPQAARAQGCKNSKQSTQAQLRWLPSISRVQRQMSRAFFKACHVGLG